ncbi:MAG: site-specific integrase, partial [Actinomycetota bacterium]|nr:site-specific integrase [Actinomycetota bacterium]
MAAEAQRVEDAQRSGTYVAPIPRAEAPTVAGQAERWMATRGHLSAAIRARHRSVLNAWILPALARLRVVDVRAEHLEKLLVDITATGRGPDTRINVYQALNQLLDHAVTTGSLDANPCRCVVAGTSRRKRRVRPFTRAELDRLLAQLDPPDDLFVLVMAYTGLRWGEMAALTAGQIDFTAGTIVVDRALKSDRTIGPPKTSANRSVHMAERIVQPLRDHIEPHRLRDHQLLWLWSTEGGPVWKDNWRQRVWYPALRAAGLDRRVPYDLRHTCASWLIAKGANPKDVMDWLGHCSLRTTM